MKVLQAVLLAAEVIIVRLIKVALCYALPLLLGEPDEIQFFGRNIDIAVYSKQMGKVFNFQGILGERSLDFY